MKLTKLFLAAKFLCSPRGLPTLTLSSLEETRRYRSALRPQALLILAHKASALAKDVRPFKPTASRPEALLRLT